MGRTVSQRPRHFVAGPSLDAARPRILDRGESGSRSAFPRMPTNRRHTRPKQPVLPLRPRRRYGRGASGMPSWLPSEPPGPALESRGSVVPCRIEVSLSSRGRRSSGSDRRVPPSSPSPAWRQGDGRRWRTRRPSTTPSRIRPNRSLAARRLRSCWQHPPRRPGGLTTSSPFPADGLWRRSCRCREALWMDGGAAAHRSPASRRYRGMSWGADWHGGCLTAAEADPAVLACPPRRGATNASWRLRYGWLACPMACRQRR